MSNDLRKAQQSNKIRRAPRIASPGSVRKWRWLVGIRNGLAAIFLTVLAGAAVAFCMAISVAKPVGETLLCLVFILLVCSLGICIVGLPIQFLLERQLQRTFQNRDITGLGCWIETLSTLHWSASHPTAQEKSGAGARAALLAQLPLLTEETASLLRPQERLALYKMLPGQDAQLISAALKAIPLLSDAHALPFLQHLAEGKGPAAINPELQAEAAASLTQLQTTLALNRSAQVLLRASSQPSQTPTAELLIPAHGASETDPSQLLRADPQK
ncbi:MAG: hypothetical protein JWL77_6699 [Chthonomonadaceae bacterium]|nr:hypothetical protein [Chthonomonadaceae bacterium]